jgi:hypothetical protein
MRKLLAAATAVLSLLGATGPVQAQSHRSGSFHSGGFHSGGFRGNGFRGNGFRGRNGAFVAGAVGLGLGAALASPYYYGPGYDYDYGPGYAYGPGDYYDAPPYACGEWRRDRWGRRVWVNDC